MDENRIVFFRNDDAGLYSKEPVSSELINLTNIFIEENVPVSHGVVPAVVNIDTVEWLKKIKLQYPKLIGIDQHGYKHQKHDRGEFGGSQSYLEQKHDIASGMELMKKYFGSAFSCCFSSPWVRYNRNTKKICDELGFRVFSGGVSPKFNARIFNSIGRLLNSNVIGKKEVSYHRKNNFTQRGFNILEISPGIDVIQDYRLKTIKPLELILPRYEQCKKHFNVIGFLLHQWVFDSKDKLDIIRKLLFDLKSDSHLSFKLIEEIKEKRIDN